MQTIIHMDWNLKSPIQGNQLEIQANAHFNSDYQLNSPSKSLYMVPRFRTTNMAFQSVPLTNQSVNHHQTQVNKHRVCQRELKAKLI